MLTPMPHTIGHLLLQITFIFPQNPIKTNQNLSQTHSHSELRPNKTDTVQTDGALSSAVTQLACFPFACLDVHHCSLVLLCKML